MRRSLLFFKVNTVIGMSMLLLISIQISAQQHPSLILTQKEVTQIRNHLGSIPVFDQTLAKVKKEIDLEIDVGIQVPIPKDMAGGYTHDRHKKNASTLQKAGILYQLLGDKKYATYAAAMLKEYATLYPTLPLHPQKRSYARGKFFWQCLNDAHWLVYVSQAYDCIYEFLTPKDRAYLEKNLFLPYADFLSKDTPQFFNRIHNHSTWGNVAVGMIGLVMENDDLVDRALYGLKDIELDKKLKDNDGGLILDKNQKAGFFANLDQPFSPDGYYTEGPYYQRYAMYPFMIFAQALQNKKPELSIFKYKNGVLIKAVYALLNLTKNNGDFYPLNDAQKGMSYYAKELVSAVDIAYYFGKQDKQLLAIANKQNKVQLDATGLSIALALNKGQYTSFDKKSIELNDGSNGTEGGIGILRSKDHPFELLLKYTSQGLGHGHYDKLSFSYYHHSEEILQDYGLARFVNIEQKNGGGYLKENKTWAKQSIAHNTLVQDETSHFGGVYETASKHHSEKYIFDSSDPKKQIVSAIEKNAYRNTQFQRTLVMMEDDSFENPIVFDILKVDSDTTHQYDLPYYYKGQIINTNIPLETNTNLAPLGSKNGYQHLWLEGKGILSNQSTAQTTWLANHTFYSISTALQKDDEILFCRIGANDPAYNLRRDPTIILRKPNTQNGVFITAIETHGAYSPVTEIAKNTTSAIAEIKIIPTENPNYIAWTVKTHTGYNHIFIFCITDNSKETEHSLRLHDQSMRWKGPLYHIKTRIN